MEQEGGAIMSKHKISFIIFTMFWGICVLVVTVTLFFFDPRLSVGFAVLMLFSLFVSQRKAKKWGDSLEKHLKKNHPNRNKEGKNNAT